MTKPAFMPLRRKAGTSTPAEHAADRQVAADALDLVAQFRRVLEPELLGRLEHLLLERDRKLLELLLRHALDLVAAAAARARHVRLVEREELGDVGDALDDRQGLRPVLLVVGQLHRGGGGSSPRARP